MHDVGRRIQHFRRELGMSQNDLASNICSQSNISKIEKGLYTPSFFLLSKMAERLNIEVEYLYSDSLSTYFEQRKIILLQYLEEQNYKAISALVDDYEENYQSQYEKKYIMWMKSISQDRIHQNRELAKLYIEKSYRIKSEVEDYELDFGILNVMTIVYRDSYDSSKMKQLFSEMFNRILKYDLKTNIVIKSLLSMSTYYYHQKDYRSVSKFSKYALKILEQKQSIYLLDYHLYNAASAMYYLDKAGLNEKRELEMAKAIARYNNHMELFETINEFQKTMNGVKV